MLMIGSKVIGMPVLSLHLGGKIATVKKAIIDPEDLCVIAYVVEGPIIQNDPEVGNILMAEDVREMNPEGIIIDSSDVFVVREDVIRIDKIMSLNFDVIGLKVLTANKRKLGKVADYTLDSQSLMIYQLIVQRPMGLMSLSDPQLTINRSQIVEIDDYTVTIKHDKEQVKVPERKEEAAIAEEIEEQKREFVNPFRKPNYAPEESSESASSISE